MTITGGLLALVTSGHAAISATELAVVEANAWRARMGFHLLAIRGDNPEDREALRVLLAEGGQETAALKSDADPKQEKTAADLESAWQALSARALDNPLASLGYADYEAMSEMNTTTLHVVELAETGQSASSDYLDIVDLSVAMQRVASEYVALAAFPSAGLPTGTGLEPMDFAMEAKQIDDSLAALKKKYQGDTPASEVLAFVGQRWAFVRGSVPKMNDADSSKVPYLFYRYATQVAERVEALVAGQ
ncbi:hypothetical protein [Alcanivorax sp.]|uniref:hypothetical protein n=1 Tax=Alcanivorax sp. TaxID=1872427 RepID=UPI0025B9F075|nr:hypothetical protein [Alcanivorax sp.]